MCELFIVIKSFGLSTEWSRPIIATHLLEAAREIVALQTVKIRQIFFFFFPFQREMSVVVLLSDPFCEEFCEDFGWDLLDRLWDLSINHLYINLSKHKVKLSKNIRFIFNATKNRLLWWSLIILWLRLSRPQSVSYKQLYEAFEVNWTSYGAPIVGFIQMTPQWGHKLSDVNWTRVHLNNCVFIFFDVHKFLFQH